MIEIIDVDNIETYPLKLKNILEPYAENLYARCGENIALDEYEAIDISALNSLNEVMSEFVFKAYHNTRVCSVESIKKEGIVLLKRESYLARMQKLLKECAVSKNEITIFSKAIKEYLNTGFENLRKGCISFYMPKAQSQRYCAYAENFGGEIAKHALKDQYPSIYNYLKTNSEPITIEFVAPFSSFVKYRNDIFMAQLIKKYLTSYIIKKDFEFEFDSAVTKPILPEQIISIKHLDVLFF